MTQYKLLVCGGTFDLFHKGHKAFLKKVFDSSDKVLLGITSNLYIQSFKNSLQIEDFEIRKKEVEHFLESINALEKAEIVSIDNAYEPYLEISTDYQVIAVTPQTKKAALDINLKRKQRGIFELEIMVVPFLYAEDGGIISSTRIRNGEINRDGRPYLNSQWNNKNLILPEDLRAVLQEPWGEIFDKIPQGINSLKTVVVGDVTAQKFNEKKIEQFLSIVDFFIHRKIKFHKLSELGFDGQNVKKIKNPHGEITPELIQVLREAFNKKTKTVILIDGEDDLAVLPVLLISPLGFSIFYGQPDQGLVRINVNEENKEKAYRLIEGFDKK